MFKFDIADVGVGSLKVTGRHFYRVQRELSCKINYYGAFFGKRSQLWYFSFHNFTRIRDYVRGLDEEEKVMSPEFRDVITPYRSRIRSASPLPDASAIRTPISCVIKRTTVMGMSVMRIWYPNFPAATEYVATPPASLSANAVTSPGPITPKKYIQYLNFKNLFIITL